MSYLTTTKGNNMAHIIPTEIIKVNSRSKFSSYQAASQYIDTNSLSKPQHLVVERPYLHQDEFEYTHERKRAWVKTVAKEFNLSPIDVDIAESLAFKTDPVTGIGSPAIGTLQEDLEKKGKKVHYNTVRNSLKRLTDKGAIIQASGGFIGRKKQTNTYTLIGYENKLEDYSSRLVNSLNSSHDLKDINNNNNCIDYLSSEELRPDIPPPTPPEEKSTQAEKLMQAGVDAKSARILGAYIVAKCMSEGTVTHALEQLAKSTPRCKGAYLRTLLNWFHDAQSTKSSCSTTNMIEPTSLQKTSDEVGCRHQTKEVAMRPYKIRNINAEQDMRAEALERAQKRLKAMGVNYPLMGDYSDVGAYMDALEAYRYKEQEVYRACLREIEGVKVDTGAKAPTKQIWSEIAYS